MAAVRERGGMGSHQFMTARTGQPEKKQPDLDCKYKKASTEQPGQNSQD
jgi:hypothetical protein